MEPKKRILVIDDELQLRKIHYDNALKEMYEVEYTENADFIYNMIKNNKVDLYIIDLNLYNFIDPNTNDHLHVNSILNAVGRNKPIILLSGSYKELMNKNRLTPIIRNAAEEGFNIATYLVWDDVLRAGAKDDKGYKETLYNKINLAIYKDRSPYDFGVVCALKQELDPFMENFEKRFVKTYSIDGIFYKRSWLETQGGHKLRFVATYSDYMGISDASILATHMASKLGIKKIFMIGVCGGRESEGVNIGDVIIPKESIAFQRGKLNENGFSYGVQIAQPKESGFIKCDEAHDILKSLRSNYFMKLLKAGKDSFESKNPEVHYEAMACADYVIDKKGEIDNIAKTIAKRKLCAVDMESYAIYRVGAMLDVETMVIKSVMDLTNDKSDKYKSYAAFMAANYLYQLLYQEKL